MSLTPSLRLPSHPAPSKTSWLTEKKSFKIADFTTVHGDTLPPFDLGFETYGQLNEQKDNAILICHYFTGSSHAAGRYQIGDAEPGYWDDLIGPGKDLDTNRYYVVAIDILCNVCPSLPTVKTVGPATLHPQTGQPFGMTFPKIRIEDMVRSQKAILDHLGIEHLHAVVGASLGSMQAWQWAADFPDMVPKIVTLIGSGFETPPFVCESVELWARMLRLDPAWKNGQYYDSGFPKAGMEAGLEILTWNCLSSEWADIYGQNGYKQIAQQRAQFIDPNHFLYIIEAIQNFSVRDKLPNIKAESLVIAASSDFLMKPEFSRTAVQECRDAGLKSTYAELAGEGGHLDGLFAISRIAPEIKKFIEA